MFLAPTVEPYRKRHRSLRPNRSETKNGGRCFKTSSFET
jgi:hypothetical protein